MRAKDTIVDQLEEQFISGSGGRIKRDAEESEGFSDGANGERQDLDPPQRAAEEPIDGISAERARKRVEETTLFIEQAQTVYTQT